MIINHKHKYIFVGLPFSASSAISKELLEQYDGVELYHKHANIPLLLHVQPDFKIQDYFVFAVVRDPVEMCFSVYNKHVTNPHNKFTDPALFIENGGFVSLKARKFYQRFQKNQWDFEQFLNHKFPYFPYDNNLSLNKEFLTRTICFEHLQKDFDTCLKEIGLAPVRALPLYNKTVKKASTYTVPVKTATRIFGPFFKGNHLDSPLIDQKNISFLSRMKYVVLGKLRNRKILKYDLRQMNNKFSMNTLKDER